MNFLKYLQLPIFLVAFHLNASIDYHPSPSPPPTPRSYLSSNDQFQTRETFLNAYWRRLIVGGDLKSSTDASAEKFVAGRERYPGIQNGRLVVFHPCSTDVTTKQAYPIRRIDPWKEKCNKVWYCKDFSLSSLHFTKPCFWITLHEFDDIHFVDFFRFSEKFFAISIAINIYYNNDRSTKF